MKGFRLKTENQIVNAALDQGVVSLMFTRVSNKENDLIHLQLRGRDEIESRELLWVSQELQIGEHFTIEVIETAHPSEPKSSTKIDDEKLLLEDKLRAYHSLKKELEEAGII